MIWVGELIWVYGTGQLELKPPQSNLAPTFGEDFNNKKPRGSYIKAKSLCFGAKRQKILPIFGGDLKK